MIALVAYLLAIAAFGSAFYRRRSTAREYFLGGRTMGWLPAGISIVAADLSAISIMGAPAWAYKHNLELIWVTCGYPLMAPLAILVFVPFYARLQLFTAYEYLERRFSLAVRLLVSTLFQLLRAWHVAVTIYGPALVIHLVTGLSVWKSVLLMGLFTTLYTTLGGMRAVIWTDVIQFATVISGIVTLLVVALHQTPGGLAGALRLAAATGHLQFVDLSWDPARLTTLWACLAGGCVLALASVTTDQAILQRLFTTRSAADCRRSLITQAVVLLPVTALLNLVGLVLFAFYRAHPERLTGLTNSDAIVPFFVVRELPAGIAGLVTAALFAASMGVMSAGVNSLTTATTIDFYQRLGGGRASSHHYAAAGRLGSAAWGAVVTLLALLADRAGDLVIAYAKVNSVLGGPMLGVFLLGILTRKVGATGALAGSASGLLAVIIVSLTTNWSFFYYGAIGLGVTLVAGMASLLLLRPPEPDRIRGLVFGDEPAAPARSSEAGPQEPAPDSWQAEPAA
jgi:SSS family transporter